MTMTVKITNEGPRQYRTLVTEITSTPHGEAPVVGGTHTLAIGESVDITIFKGKTLRVEEQAE